jgi:hypothetical protein
MTPYEIRCNPGVLRHRQPLDAWDACWIKEDCHAVCYGRP